MNWIALIASTFIAPGAPYAFMATAYMDCPDGRDQYGGIVYETRYAQSNHPHYTTEGQAQAAANNMIDVFERIIWIDPITKDSYGCIPPMRTEVVPLFRPLMPDVEQ